MENKQGAENKQGDKQNTYLRNIRFQKMRFCVFDIWHWSNHPLPQTQKIMQAVWSKLPHLKNKSISHIQNSLTKYQETAMNGTMPSNNNNNNNNIYDLYRACTGGSMRLYNDKKIVPLSNTTSLSQVLPFSIQTISTHIHWRVNKTILARMMKNPCTLTQTLSPVNWWLWTLQLVQWNPCRPPPWLFHRVDSLTSVLPEVDKTHDNYWGLQVTK